MEPVFRAANIVRELGSSATSSTCRAIPAVSPVASHSRPTGEPPLLPRRMRSARPRQGSGRLTPVVPGGRLHRAAAEATIGPVSEIPMYQGGPVDLAELELLAHAASPGSWMSWIEGRDHVAGDSFIETGAEDLYPRCG